MRYREAAAHFAAAAARASSAHETERIGYLFQQAGALYSQGDEFGDNAVLEAVQALHGLLILCTWAMTQMNLGTALLSLSEHGMGRETGTARFEEAVTAFRDALKERTRERAPLNWALTQMNLGTALLRLGERETGKDTGTARLEDAITAYHNALKEFTRERTPLQWAISTGNQGAALILLAERLNDSTKARTALQQIEAALATLRDGGEHPATTYYRALLPKARALFDRLTNTPPRLAPATP